MIPLQGKSVMMGHDEVLDVTREAPATYTLGKPQPGQSSTFKLKGNVQPVDGRDLLIVPEGDRFKEQLYFYVRNPKRNVGVIIVNDRVRRECLNYQVQSVENWGSYCRARMMRIDIGTERTP